MSRATPEAVASAVRRFSRSDLAMHHALSELVGVTPTELAALAHLGADGPLSQEALRQRLRVKKSTMTALVDRLEAAGRLTRGPHPTDRRVTLLTASDEVRQGWLLGTGRLGEALAAAARQRTPAERAAIVAFLDDAALLQEQAALDLSNRG